MTDQESKIKDFAIQLFLQDEEGWLTGGNPVEKWFLLAGHQQATYMESSALAIRTGQIQHLETKGKTANIATLKDFFLWIAANTEASHDDVWDKITKLSNEDTVKAKSVIKTITDML